MHHEQIGHAVAPIFVIAPEASAGLVANMEDVLEVYQRLKAPIVHAMRVKCFSFPLLQNFGPHRWFFTASGRNRLQHSGPMQALTVQGRNV